MESIKKFKKLFSTFMFVCFLLILFRSFIADQIATRGIGYLGYKMYRDAIRQYEKALIFTPRNTEIRNWLAYAYSSMGNKKRAIEIYNRTIKMDPENIEAYYDLGMIYVTKRDFETAKEYFLKAVSGPQDDSPYYRMSLKMLDVCYEKLAETEKTK